MGGYNPTNMVGLYPQAPQQAYQQQPRPQQGVGEMYRQGGYQNAPSQFSYAPQGQPNSYTPYNNMYPNLQLAPKNNSGNIFTNQYVTPTYTPPKINNPSYAERYNARRRAYDSGGGNDAALQAQQAAEAAAAQQAILDEANMQRADVKKLTWRA